MRPLGLSRTSLDTNLVPAESSEIKAVKRQFALTVVFIAIAIPMMMRAAGIGLNKLAKNTETRISNRKKTEISKEAYALFKELTSLNQQIEMLSKRPAELNDILNSRPAVGWLQFLRDVRTKTPNSVRITELSSTRDAGIVLEGLALSYEAARLFEKSLNDSDYINMATLVEASREDNADALIEYKINCSLNMEKNKI